MIQLLKPEVTADCDGTKVFPAVPDKQRQIQGKIRK